MKIKTQNILKYNAGWVAILLFLFSIACKEQDIKDIHKYTVVDEDFPIEISVNVELIYSDSAMIKAILNSPLMKRYAKDENLIEMPDGLNVVFYEGKLVETSRLRADYGVRYIDENRTEVKYDVLVINIDGDSLMTEHLIWDEVKDIIYSEVFVKVVTADEIIMAEGFESDISFTDYQFYNIKGVINIADDN